MRVTNLILHSIAVIVMLPDLIFIGINTLMGLAYLEGVEFLIVGAAVLLFGAAFLVSSVGGMINFTKYRARGPKVYMRRELISHGITALSFAGAIIYILSVVLTSSGPLDDFSMKINLAGFCLALAGIIVTVAGRKTSKQVAAIAKAPTSAPVAQSVSRPKFCPNCGKPTGEAGDFCGSCGAKLVR